MEVCTKCMVGRWMCRCIEMWKYVQRNALTVLVLRLNKPYHGCLFVFISIDDGLSPMCLHSWKSKLLPVRKSLPQTVHM